MGDIDLAIETLNKATENSIDGKPVDAIVRDYLEVRLDAMVAAARLHYLHRDPGEALDRLSIANEIYQQRLSNNSAVTFDETLAIGQALQLLSRADASQTNQALRVLESAISMQPDNARGHVAIGNLLLDRYNNAEAAEAFADALAVDPINPHALLGRARSQRFDRSGGTSEAARQVLEVNPNSVAALALLARQFIEVEKLRCR